MFFSSAVENTEPQTAEWT